MESFLIVNSIALWIVLLCNLLLTLAVIRRLNKRETSSSSNVIELKIGRPAPPFQASLLNNEAVSLTTYRGKKVFFLFAGPHCKACHDILPGIAALVPQAKNIGREIVLVSDGDAADTGDFLQKLNVQLPAIAAPRGQNTFLDDYKVNGTPAYCAIDENGIVQAAGYPDMSASDFKLVFSKTGSH